MKKLVIISFIALSINSFAQEFNGGFLAGLTASQVDGDGYGGFDKTGVIVGVFVNRQISDKTTWQMELIYSHRGSKKNMQPDKDDFVFFKIHLEYLEVPLIINYEYSERISFDVGLSIGRLIKYYYENEQGEFTSNPFYKYSLGLIIGVNYHLSEHVIIALRETYSIYPIRGYANNGRWWYKTGSFSNSLSFTVNYQF